MKALALAVALAFSVAARAESPAELEARQHFTAAQKLFEHARWAEALAEYQASYALSKYPAILYKIALCQDQLGQNAAALEAYQQYLDADPSSDRRQGIEERIAKLKELLAPPPAAPPPAPVEVAPAPVVTPAPATPVAATVEKPARTPVYKKWWVWTIVGVGVAGIALGVGLGVGLSHSFSPNLGTFSNALVHF